MKKDINAILAMRASKAYREQQYRKQLVMHTTITPIDGSTMPWCIRKCSDTKAPAKDSMAVNVDSWFE